MGHCMQRRQLASLLDKQLMKARKSAGRATRRAGTVASKNGCSTSQKQNRRKGVTAHDKWAWTYLEHVEEVEHGAPVLIDNI